MSGGIERRVQPRYDVNLNAELRTQRGETTAATRNLSRGGVALVADRALAVGERVQLTLYLVVDGIEDATTAPLVIDGVVSWCMPGPRGTFAAGLRFDQPSAAAQLQVDRFLRALAGAGAPLSAGTP